MIRGLIKHALHESPYFLLKIKKPQRQKSKVYSLALTLNYCFPNQQCSQWLMILIQISRPATQATF
jgi:hypothetical protein